MEICDVPHQPSYRIFSGKVQFLGKEMDSTKAGILQGDTREFKKLQMVWGGGRWRMEWKGYPGQYHSGLQR